MKSLIESSVDQPTEEAQQPLLSSSGENAESLPVVVDAIFKSTMNQPKLGKVGNGLLQLFLSGLSVIGSLNYLSVTREAIENDDDYLILRNIEYAEVSTVLFSALILLNSMQIFKGWTREEHLSQDIEKYFPQGSRFRYHAGNLFLTVGSALSSIPLSIIYLNYSQDPLVMKIVMGSLIELANTLMHFLPFFATLHKPPYNWPFILGGAVVSGVKSLLGKNEVQEEDERVRHVGRLLQKLVMKINIAAQKKYNESLVYQGAFDWNIYNLVLTDEIEAVFQQKILSPLITTDAGSSLRVWEAVIQEVEQKQEGQTSQTAEIMQTGIRVLAVGIMELGCIGYTVNVFRTLIGEFGSSFGILAAIVPAYAYAVLVAFFAELTALTSMNLAGKLVRGESLLSVDDKMFPRFSLVLLLAAAAFSLADFTGNLQVNKDNFEDGTFLGVIDVCGIIGFALVSFLCISQLHGWTSQEYVTYAGTEDQKQLNEVRAAIATASSRLMKIDPRVAVEMIENSSEEDLSKWLGEDKKSLARMGFFKSGEPNSSVQQFTTSDDEGSVSSI